MDLWCEAGPEELRAGAQDQAYVSGLTHNYYRYPARFSPAFVRQAIRSFSRPGDLVLDPFAGGGTTLVEAAALGRAALGVDISTLAHFLCTVKTTALSDEQLGLAAAWLEEVQPHLSLRNLANRPWDWIEKGYQRNASGKQAWPIRKTLELALACLAKLPDEDARRFVRCLLLRTGQWALEIRDGLPSAREFRRRLLEYFEEMAEGCREYTAAVAAAPAPVLCLHLPASELTPAAFATLGTPKLVLTSPPYPGVHVVYHRWQVQGRRETPAPFWLADCVDGMGESFYTFGDRRERELVSYFAHLLASFRAIAAVIDHDTLLVQLVSFSHPLWQLGRYLSALEEAGFEEVQLPEVASSSDGRLWRPVPNRRWYASQRTEIGTSKEVALFHRLRSDRLA